MKPVFISAILFFIQTSTSGAYAACPEPILVETVLNSASRLHLKLSWTSEQVLSDSGTALSARQPIEAFQRWIISLISPIDQGSLVQGQMKLFGLPSPNQFTAFRQTFLPHVTPIGCLESTLLGLHESKFPQRRLVEVEHDLTGPEFEAYIMTRGSGSAMEVKAILASAYEKNNIGVGPAAFPDSKGFLDKTRDDLLKSGFLFSIHIHNHPFSPHNPTKDVAGVVMASGCSDSGDIKVYHDFHKTYDLAHAWITNGFDTMKYDLGSADFAAWVVAKDRDFGCLNN